MTQRTEIAIDCLDRPTDFSAQLLRDGSVHVEVGARDSLACEGFRCAVDVDARYYQPRMSPREGFGFRLQEGEEAAFEIAQVAFEARKKIADSRLEPRRDGIASDRYRTR